jgi:hypothetical protein
MSTMILAGRVPVPSDQDLADLREKLTAETRRKLESKTPADQWQTIVGGMRQAIQQQIASGGGKSCPPPRSSPLLPLQCLATFL